MSITQNEDLNRRNKMNLMYEDLARVHMEQRLRQARERRRSVQMVRVRRLNRRAERVNEQRRLVLARSS